VFVVKHTRGSHNHRDAMGSLLTGRVTEVLKNGQIDLVTYFNAFVDLQIDSEASYQRVWTNLSQVLHGFFIL